MMRQMATVVRENGRLMAEVVRPEACEACHACKYGRSERRLLDLPPGNYRDGEEVELTLPDGKVGAAALLAYGMPLALMLAGMGGGSALGGGSEWFSVIGALAGVALALVILKGLEPHLRKNGAFRPEVCPCQTTQNQQ